MAKLILCFVVLTVFLSAATATLIDIGDGSSYNGSTEFPCPYGASMASFTDQYLITAAELQAAGAAAGTFNSLAFNVQALNGCGALGRLTISMGATTLTELTSEPVEDLQLVMQVFDYQPQLGWNTHSFSSPFVWDGSSNLIVEINHRNNPISANASVYRSSTAPYPRASTIYHGLLANLLFTQRPNLLFDLEIAETVLQLPHSESFNTADFPSGWTAVPEIGSWEPCWQISASNHAGGVPNEARYYLDMTTPSRLITPKVSLGGGNSLKVGFRHRFMNDEENQAIVKLQYSTDLLNWTDAGWQSSNLDGNLAEQVLTMINGLSSPYVYLAWTVAVPGYWWEGYWYLDDLSLSQPLAHDVAVLDITNLPGITDDSVFPNIKVANLGQNTESYQVLMRGTTRYLHYLPVSNLAPGEQRLIECPPYLPEGDGVNIIQANSLLDGDLDPSNDELVRSFACLDLHGRTGFSFVTDGSTQMGLASFPLARPSYLALVADGEHIFNLPGAEWIDGNIYGVESWSSQDRLAIVNPQTAEHIYLGNTGDLDFTGLAYDPTGNILHAANSSGLYSLNPETGALLATIGTFNVADINMQSIALCQSTGYLYGIDNFHDAFYRINTSTGAATLIGPLGIDLYLQQDLGFDQEFGDLFLTGRTGQDEYALYWIDTQTGHAYKGGEFNPGWHLMGYCMPLADPDPPVAHIQSGGTLIWSAVQGASHYKIYGSSDPEDGFILLGQTENTSWTDPGFPVARRFYRVTSATGR